MLATSFINIHAHRNTDGQMGEFAGTSEGEGNINLRDSLMYNLT